MKILTNYTLKIGYQKPTTNITGYTHITDKVEYAMSDEFMKKDGTWFLSMIVPQTYDADGNVILNGKYVGKK